MLDEYFAESDDRFVGLLLTIQEPLKLAAVTERWKVDPRPWARKMLWAYLDAPWQTRGHNVVVKRLYKQAERTQDLEIVAAFAHRFDCLVRRELRLRWHWDSATSESSTSTELVLPRNGLPGQRPGTKAPRWQVAHPGSVLFSARTRYYLRRRAMRVLRHLAFRDPERYVTTSVQMLRRYRDDDLANGANILDSWSLLQTCYRTHPALEFGRDHVQVVEGHTLQELTPAPRHLDAWRTEHAVEQLWQLLTTARSRLVTTWSIAMLQQEHAGFLAKLSAEQVRALFTCENEELETFGVALLRERQDLGSWTLDDWLPLLHVDSLTVQQAICDLMQQHIAPERFQLSQVRQLALAMASPIASLGLTLLRARSDLHTEPQTLVDLSRARCLAVAEELASIALSVLGQREHYQLDQVIRFFDAPVSPVRTAAWTWLQQGGIDADHPGQTDPALWSRLLESPHESERLRLVRALTERCDLPGVDVTNLVPLWSAVLLGIHRGGRHKLQALHQLSRAASANPEHVEQLLPVFAVAVRSVRAPEARVGLAALVAAVERLPSLREPVLRTFPELRFVSNGATS